MPDRQPDDVNEPTEHGLADHLRAAIRQNVARRPDYRRRGGMRAWWLSVVLVAHERSLLPFAGWLDRRSRPFQREGSPILAADLQPMSLSPPPGRQLDGVGSVPRDLLWLPAGRIWSGVKELRALLLRRGFDASRLQSIADLVEEALDGLAYLHEALGARFALTEHVLESLGISAVNGLAYAEQSDGRTLRLSRRFVTGQVLLLPGALTLDVLAGPVHARGVPIFIDDVPPVPFREAWADFKTRQPDADSLHTRQLETRSTRTPHPVPLPGGEGTS